MQMIKEPYLLVTMCCPCYVDSLGKRYLDPLWAKDLSLHTMYIEQLTIACPRIDRDPPASFVSWESLPLDRVHVVDLPELPSLWAAIIWLPVLVLRLWSAIGRATIVHSGIAGWPIPDGWLTIPLARLRRKFVIVVVKSSFWRISNQETASFKKKMRAVISENLNRWCVDLAHIAIFTHESYKRSLLIHHPERGHVIPASWIDDAFILSQSEAEAEWKRKIENPDKLNLVFVGRLIPEKGITLLLEALQFLHTPPGKISCEIVGDGGLMPQCVQLAERLKNKVDVKFLGAIEYGLRFFNLLTKYDAILVPSISDEQPRIAFDAFARAIPVLGFETEGLASCVEDGVTGRLCPIDAHELAMLIDWAFINRRQLGEMGLRGLTIARSLTHREMHLRRLKILIPKIEAFMRAHKQLGPEKKHVTG